MNPTMSERPDSLRPAETTTARPQRSLSLFGAIVIGCALVGYLRGITEGDSTSPEFPVRVERNRQRTAEHVAPAATYSAIGNGQFRPGKTASSELKDLKYHRPSRLDPVMRTDSMKAVAMADRSVNRAFDGAPPVIPHKVDQQSASSCLICHGQGLKLGDRLATKISHAHFSSCTQCHVESLSGGPFDSTEDPANGFAGLNRAGPGTRAHTEAPPTIPHSTWLREDCMSCHGTMARPGLRTTHPWLTSCTQCHVASADLDPCRPWTRDTFAAPARSVTRLPRIQSRTDR